MRRDWDALPEGRGPNTSREWFGGDLPGIEQHLDHIEQLGANVIYMTPFFPAGQHAPLRRVVVRPRRSAARRRRGACVPRRAPRTRRGLKLVGDLTMNHCGVTHDWFERAAADERSPERDFFYFDKRLPHGYAAWVGVRTLPTLNWRSEELHTRMRAILRHWLDAGLDGWRIDVANMVGRYRDLDVNHDVAAWTRDVVAAVAARRRARSRLPPRPRRHGLARHDELRGLPAAGLVVAARRPHHRGHLLAGARAAVRRRRHGLRDAGVPCGRAVGRHAELVDAARQPRCGAVRLRDRHRASAISSASACSSRRRACRCSSRATSSGSEAHGARMRAARCRGTGPSPGTRRCSARPRSSRSSAGRATRSPAAASATCTSPTTRSRTSARRAPSGCSASRREHRTIRSPRPFADLETLYGGDARDGVLPADGPAFHIWRING